MSGVFTATFEDPRGPEKLTTLGIIINSELAHDHGCYVYYDGKNHMISLMDDVKELWLPGASLGSIDHVQNSYCVLDASKSTVTTDSNKVTVKAAVAFKTAFVGLKQVYVYGAEQSGTNTGYILGGKWRVASAVDR